MIIKIVKLYKTGNGPGSWLNPVFQDPEVQVRISAVVHLSKMFIYHEVLFKSIHRTYYAFSFLILRNSTLLKFRIVLHERGSMKGNKVVTYPVIKYAIYAICEIRVLI